MEGARELLPRLGQVLLGQADPVRHGGGVAAPVSYQQSADISALTTISPCLMHRVGLYPTLLSAQACHFDTLCNFIHLLDK